MRARGRAVTPRQSVQPGAVLAPLAPGAPPHDQGNAGQTEGNAPGRAGPRRLANRIRQRALWHRERLERSPVEHLVDETG